jgi:type VI secretion system lysozyme-like protein
MTDYYRPPLLDRLLQGRENDAADWRKASNRDDVIESIRRELCNLLNTRCHVRPSSDGSREMTVVDYGLGDLLQCYPDDPAACHSLGVRVSRAIEAFEPRLCGVIAVVKPTETRPRRCLVEIDGSLNVESIRKPVFFRLIAGDPQV